MRKLNKQAGFTLAELLIVVAIIAILVAIGIPAFSTAMERSRETVDLANIRGAYAEFIAGSLGGKADSGYYQLDIKQRDPSTWIVDASGFLTNVKNDRMPTNTDTGVGSSAVVPADALKLKTGPMWVKFTFVDPGDETGKTLAKVPTCSFVSLTLSSDTPAQPTKDGSNALTDTQIIDKNTEGKDGHWYLTKEQVS